MSGEMVPAAFEGTFTVTIAAGGVDMSPSPAGQENTDRLPRECFRSAGSGRPIEVQPR